MNKVFKNAQESLTDIKDGSTLMLGGFGLCGIPENCIIALVEKRVKNFYKKSKTGTKTSCRNFLKLVKTVRMYSNSKKDLIKAAFDNLITKSNHG